MRLIAFDPAPLGPIEHHGSTGFERAPLARVTARTGRLALAP